MFFIAQDSHDSILKASKSSMEHFLILGVYFCRSFRVSTLLFSVQKRSGCKKHVFVAGVCIVAALKHPSSTNNTTAKPSNKKQQQQQQQQDCQWEEYQSGVQQHLGTLITLPFIREASVICSGIHWRQRGPQSRQSLKEQFRLTVPLNHCVGCFQKPAGGEGQQQWPLLSLQGGG